MRLFLFFLCFSGFAIQDTQAQEVAGQAIERRVGPPFRSIGLTMLGCSMGGIAGIWSYELYRFHFPKGKRYFRVEGLIWFWITALAGCSLGILESSGEN